MEVYGINRAGVPHVMLKCEDMGPRRFDLFLMIQRRYWLSRLRFSNVQSSLHPAATQRL
ncbi:hypothetical protein B0T14DRAFT_317205 [Immersiella caudata]|uniref:Uncharacterized protein n=1 Tax=Immersiella caudata TaxID=314043 RepID=A0AA39WCR0_9PEZI|nr:hypothetical protein B0T14DRAFT_317205 [Immersiella caudata]